ncbi:MAG: zinc ribbon domain-containing protein [Armatimonadota bacterium]|nr:zinc ribbon domain-containing protein [Armatimonadota bacterium]
MPIYEYQCGSCGTQFELLVSRARKSASPPCEECGSEDTERVMSGFFGRGASEDGERSAVGSACTSCTASSCAGCRL